MVPNGRLELAGKPVPASSALPIGTKQVAIPLIQAGAVANLNDANLNLNETYTVNIVRGDRRTSRVVGRSLDELDLPEATTIGGIVRGDKLLIAHHDIIIEPGDHLILFVMDKRQMPQVDALLQAGHS